jgi:hypothetical protein
VQVGNRVFTHTEVGSGGSRKGAEINPVSHGEVMEVDILRLGGREVSLVGQPVSLQLNWPVFVGDNVEGIAGCCIGRRWKVSFACWVYEGKKTAIFEKQGGESC